MLQVDSCYGAKTIFEFCDLCDLENQGHNPKTNRLLWGLWRRHIPGFKLIAAKLLELSCQNCDFGQTDRWMDRQTERDRETGGQHGYRVISVYSVKSTSMLSRFDGVHSILYTPGRLKTEHSACYVVRTNARRMCAWYLRCNLLKMNS